MTTSTGTTYFLYDGEKPVCEIDGIGAITAVNTWGANGLVSRDMGYWRKARRSQRAAGWR